MDIIALSIPIFLALVVVELLVVAGTRKPYLRLNDSVNDLSLGILSQLFGIFTKLILAGLYYLAYEYARVQLLGVPAWPTSIAESGLVPVALTWTVAFLLVDMAYYWFHRLSHEVNLLWGMHVVHHQSEEYNLTVALRQSGFGGLLNWIFYVPLAFMGIPLWVMLTCYGINLIYQFWIHTRLIKKLPAPIEWLFNTPSHHRVHHGRNPKYIDKNYAGVLMIWDRLFGSFRAEEEEPVYGITTPLASWNPLWANVHVYVELWRDAVQSKSWKERLRIWFAAPGDRPKDVGPKLLPKPVPDAYEKYHPKLPMALKAYVLLHFLLTVPIFFGLAALSVETQLTAIVAMGFIVVLSLVNLGGLMDHKPWAMASEQGRLGTAIVLGLMGMGAGYLWAGGGVVLLGALSLWWLRRAWVQTVPDNEAATEAMTEPASAH